MFPLNEPIIRYCTPNRRELGPWSYGKEPPFRYRDSECFCKCGAGFNCLAQSACKNLPMRRVEIT